MALEFLVLLHRICYKHFGEQYPPFDVPQLLQFLIAIIHPREEGDFLAGRLQLQNLSQDEWWVVVVEKCERFLFRDYFQIISLQLGFGLHCSAWMLYILNTSILNLCCFGP